MKAIAYASEALVSFDQDQIDELCERASNNNRESGITGYLSFKNKRFFQYLEGPENAVNEIYKEIANDQRHNIQRTIDLGVIVTRRFARWHMLNNSGRDSSEIRIQDLIDDVMKSYSHNKADDWDSGRLIQEMLDQVCKFYDESKFKNQSDSKKETWHLPPYVVVLGASAGGLLPLQTIVRGIKPKLNAVFIIVQHLSPKTVTLMDTILQRDTSMGVCTARNGVKLKAGNIFVIPSGENLEISDGKFSLSKQQRVDHVPQFPIDICFRSVAREYGDRAIAVVLSGTGSDGARGAKLLQEAGGLVIAQSPETTEFDGMPKSCIDTGLVHQILAPVEISEFLNNLSNDYPDDSLVLWPAQKSEYISKVIKLLENSQIDFAHYKDETLFRRIERRRMLTNIATREEFVTLLRSSESERDELRDDILITVTNFFRDVEAWKILTQSILPILTTVAESDETFRVWVSACSTGEEAYTVAILLTELVETLDKPVKFKIYATDIERNALDRASNGCYSDKSIEHVSEERLHRFFVKRSDGYAVSRQIREKVIFAPHNFVKNAPFTRMHLVTCRNVLIYMRPELQQLALKMLHFSLNVNGILFLGPSETLGGLQSEFYPVQRQWNQFKKLRNLSLPLHLSSDQVNQTTLDKSLDAPAIVQPMQLKNEAKANGLVGLSLDALARHSANTNVLVDSTRTVLMVLSDPSGLLQVNFGKPSLDIAKMVPESIKAPLTFAFNRAFTEHDSITHRRLTCTPAGQAERQVDLQVVPHVVSGEKEAKHALIIITDSSSHDHTSNLDSDDAANDAVMRSMRTELAETKEALQAAINDLETSSNRQRSVNEQLSAANEELQSTNEELQSVNEELYTVNFEYQTKIHELSDLNQDLDNLLDSTNLGVIFLDTDLCIRRYTDVATQTVNLLPSDIGRPFVDLAHNLRYKDLIGDMRRVLSMGKTISREISRNDVDHLQIGIHPYRAGDGVAHGVLIMFRDIKRPTENVTEIQIEDPAL